VNADAAVAEQPVGGVVVHRPLMPMIGLVADPDVCHRTLDMRPIAVKRFAPRCRHVFYEAVELLVARACARLRKLLQHPLIRHPYHTRIDGVMPVVVSVLFAI